MHTVFFYNRFIAHLNPYNRDQLLNNCAYVELNAEEILSKPGETSEYVYFPTGVIISLMMQQPNEKPLSIGLVGEEGLLGVDALLGVCFSPYYAQVHAKGTALRITAQQLNQFLQIQPLFNMLLNGYIAIQNAQFAQAAICNSFHHLQQRLARFLLTLRDRLHSSKFFITQDTLATLLGVRRVGITRAASVLLQRNIIYYNRGNMEIINHEALEKIACHCYATDNLTYKSILQTIIR
jgi:CRP-like cAMP-binding protein